MSNEENGRNSNGNGTSDTDKYYAELYNDLPKEVVDILMQTHPLMGKTESSETTAYRSRRPQREDVEQVREARMQQVGSEINEIRRAPQQEGEPTRYVSRRSRSGETNENTQDTPRHTMDHDDYEDGIQYVSVMPAKKKSRIVEEVTVQTATPARRKKTRRDDNLFEDMSGGQRPRYEDIDFEERAKQEHLDNLYDDDYDEDDGRSNKLGIVLGVVALILIIFLIFKAVSLSSKLEEAETKLTNLGDISTKYEEIQLEKMQLEEQLEALQNPDANAGADGDSDTPSTDTPSTDTPATTTPNTGTTATTDSYTVVDGDTAWKIATKVYGNGAEFKKILDANNLKESDTLKIGSTLKIPN